MTYLMITYIDTISNVSYWHCSWMFQDNNNHLKIIFKWSLHFIEHIYKIVIIWSVYECLYLYLTFIVSIYNFKCLRMLMIFHRNVIYWNRMMRLIEWLSLCIWTIWCASQWCFLLYMYSGLMQLSYVNVWYILTKFTQSHFLIQGIIDSSAIFSHWNKFYKILPLTYLTDLHDILSLFETTFDRVFVWELNSELLHKKCVRCYKSVIMELNMVNTVFAIISAQSA